MAAQYRVVFRRKGPDADREIFYLSSADATSMKPSALRAAYRKAFEKGKAKLAKKGLKPREFVCTDINCVG